jgi:CHRD domain-containing protein
MRRIPLAFPLLLLAGLASFGCSNSNMDKAAFVASLSGTAVVPPVVSTSSGNTSMSFDGASTVSYHVSVSAITRVTQVHIHSGGAGATGPIRVNLFTGPMTGRENGTLADATFAASDVQGESLDTLLGELRDGTAYVDVHTRDNPDGALRGQVNLMQ